MKNYIAIVRNENNKVTKYQDFDVESDADAHVVTYGGFVVPKPSSERMYYWVVDADAQTVTYDQSRAESDDAALAAIAYKKARRNAYPSIGDQLDMQYHDKVDDTTTWQDAIQAVKDANPKP